MYYVLLRYYYIFNFLVVCDFGYYLINNNCEKCFYDKYQLKKWQSFCIECFISYVIQKQGVINVFDCVGKQNLVFIEENLFNLILLFVEY